MNRCLTCGQGWIAAHACKVLSPTPATMGYDAGFAAGRAAGIEAAAREIGCGGEGRCGHYRPIWHSCNLRDDCREDLAERIRALAK